MKRTLRDWALLGLVGPIIIAVLVLGLVVEFGPYARIILAADDGFHSLATWAQKSPLRLAVASLGLLGFGVGAFYYRRFNLLGYGRIKLVLGLTIVWFTLAAHDMARGTGVIAVMGGVYLFVEGLNEYVEGHKVAAERKARPRAGDAQVATVTE